jgi:hypothetical protein
MPRRRSHQIVRVIQFGGDDGGKLPAQNSGGRHETRARRGLVL